MCYLRRVRVLRPRVLSKSGYFHVRRRGSASLVAVAVSALTHGTAMRVVRAGLLTVASALVKPGRVMSTRGGAARLSPASSLQCACEAVEAYCRMNQSYVACVCAMACRRTLVSMSMQISRRCGLLRPRGRRDGRQRCAWLCRDQVRRPTPSTRRLTQVSFSQFEGKVCFAQNVASA